MKRAFTLIELLTVIAIIGILSAIVIPAVSTVRTPDTIVNSEEYRLYEAWKRAYQSYYISFEEWQALRANGMLGSVQTPVKPNE